MRHNNVRRIICFVLLVVVVGGTGLEVAIADKIYRTAGFMAGKVQRANLDGSEIEDLVVGLMSPAGITIAPSGNKVYWTEVSRNKIQRANLDGSEAEEILSDSEAIGSPRGIALDPVRDKMYWASIVNRIKRAGLDGSDIEDFVTTEVLPTGVALDSAGEKLYWTTTAGGVPTIQRANLDGSDVELLVSTDISAPWDIELDLANGKMYWVDNSLGQVRRANLDGSDVEVLVTGIVDPFGIALDLNRRKVYWTSRSRGKIQKANLVDGSEVEDVVTGLDQPVAITLHSGLPDSEDCIAPPPGIVSWWPGDGDALDIISANDGELRDGVTFTPGRVGPAFTFGFENDLVTIGDPPNLQMTGDLTIMAWVFPLPDSRNRNNHIFDRRIDGCGPDIGYSLATVDGFLLFDSGPGGSPIVSGLRVPNEEWSLVAVVYNGATNTYDYYVNDLQALDVPGKPLANPANADAQIGQANGCPLESGFEGLIDEVVIYDRALSASEFNDVFFAGSAGMCRTDGPPKLSAGDVCTPSGANVLLPISLEKKGQAVASTGFTLDFPTDKLLCQDPATLPTVGCSAEALALGFNCARGPVDCNTGSVQVIVTPPIVAPPIPELPEGEIVEIQFGGNPLADPGQDLQCSTDPAECMGVNFSESECGDTAGQNTSCVTQNGCIDVQDCVRGDCNGDGVVTSADVTCQIRRIFDIDPIRSACEDCNEDGVLTSADVTCTILIIFQGP